MPAIILAIANLFGISVFRLIMYAGIAIAVISALVAVRQHYVNVGWNSHKAAVERQDNIAVAASREVQKRADACSDQNGFWDVITQGCKLQEAEEKK